MERDERRGGDMGSRLPGGPRGSAGDAAPDGNMPETTGDQRVDDAVGVIDALAARPVAEHPAVFTRVHAQLVEVLGELDAGQPSDAQRTGAD